MNERIRQLAEQAMIQTPHEFGGTYLAFSKEKFAELIVKETCDRIEREYKYALGEKTQWDMSQAVQDLIKEHFGVEE